jgi:putative peptidoglycan lipid II flippase
VQLVYQRGVFNQESTNLTSSALFWFAFSLPFAGVNLLLTRTFFSLQLPWRPTTLAVGSLFVNAAVSLALYQPFGIAGIVIGTAVGSVAMTVGQVIDLHRRLGHLGEMKSLMAMVRMVLASGLLAGGAYAVWWLLDQLLGRDLVGQLVAVGAAIGVGSLLYALAVYAMRVPEAEQVWRLISRRLRLRR